MPIGPLGLLICTAIALTAALGVAWLLVDRQDSGAVRLEDALQSVDRGSPVPAGTATAEVGAPAPDVRLDYLDGGSEQLSAHRGTPVVLNFWSSTCAPCLQEMPAIQHVSAAQEGKVTVLGVDVTDTERAGTDMVRRTGVTYRNARDPKAQVMAAFGGTALPRTVVIGADGTVLDTHSGALSAAELTDLLRRNGVLG